MEEAVFENIGRKIDDTAHNASRAASAVGDAVENGVTAAQQAARHGVCAASNLLSDAKKRVQRNPIETAAMVFSAGIAAGAAIGWLVRHKRTE
jgi:ABC-type transporter Mla subunit MlaD